MKLEIHLLPRVCHPPGFAQKASYSNKMLYPQDDILSTYFLRHSFKSLNKKKLKAYAEDMAKKAVF